MGASITLSLAFLATALASVPLARRLTGDYFPPAVLAVGTWAATLGLFFLHVIPYAAISGSTMLLVAASIGALVGSAFIGQRWSEARGVASQPTAPAFPEACLVAMSLLGLLGMAWYAWAVADVLGLSAFVDRPWRIRIALSDHSVPSRYLVLQFLCVATPILATALALTGHRIRTSVWLLVIACTLGSWISTDRTQFFVIVLTTYFMFVLRAGVRWSLGKLAVMTAAVLLGLGSYFLLVGVWQGKTPSNLNVEIRVPTLTVKPKAQSLTQGGAHADGQSAMPEWQVAVQRSLQRVSTIYLYATASYAALDVLLENPQPRTYGLQMAYPAARLLERAGLIAGAPPGIPPFVPLGLTSGSEVTFNAYTFLYYPISDFGPLGALGYCIAIGVLAGFVYGRYRQDRGSAFWLLTMGHLSAALVLTVFVNKFNNTASWYIYVWTCLPFMLATRPFRRLTMAAGQRLR